MFTFLHSWFILLMAVGMNDFMNIFMNIFVLVRGCLCGGNSVFTAYIIPIFIFYIFTLISSKCAGQFDLRCVEALNQASSSSSSSSCENLFSLTDKLESCLCGEIRQPGVKSLSLFLCH